jgi:hypothetical protein
MKKITITFIGATLLSAASYATPQATVDISLLKSELTKHRNKSPTSFL